MVSVPPPASRTHAQRASSDKMTYDHGWRSWRPSQRRTRFAPSALVGEGGGGAVSARQPEGFSPPTLNLPHKGGGNQKNSRRPSQPPRIVAASASTASSQ